MENLKIRWALHRDELEPTTRQRGIAVYNKLREWGYDAGKWDGRETADIIVCQYDFRDQANALAKAGVVVQDINDMIFADWHPCHGMFERFIGNAHAVVGGTERLGSHLRKRHPFVRVINDVIQDEYFWVKPQPHQGLNICWTGMHDNIMFFAECDAALEELSREFDFTVTFVTSTHDGSGKSNVEKVKGKPYPTKFVEWSMEALTAQMAIADVAAIPLFLNEWCACKSPQKALCFMAAGVPVVATQVEPYQQVIADGRHGCLCFDQAEWVDKLSKLLVDADLRREFSQAGLDVVEEFTAEPIATKWLQLFAEIRPV